MTEPLAVPVAPVTEAGIRVPLHNLRRTALRNSAAQAVGRITIAAVRLLVVALIVRSFGAVTFGEYSLLFTVLTIAEWLIDFGSTDVFVREICRNPNDAGRLLRVGTAWKAIQVPLAFIAVAAIPLVMGFPRHVLEAALLAGASLLFYAGVLIYRVIFRVRLSMERESIAELISAVLTIPLIVVAARAGGGLPALFAVHLVSRVIFLALCFAFGRADFRPSIAGVVPADLKWTFSATSAMGVNGLLAVGYAAADVLLLSRLSGLDSVAYYSGAQRFILPVLMIQSAIGSTLYSVVASYWPSSPGEFQKACQRGLDLVVIVAGTAICAFAAGAEFFMGILSPELSPGAVVLRILSVQAFFAAVSSTLGPVLYVTKSQKSVLRFIVATLVIKTLVLIAVVPRYGHVGTAVVAVSLEMCGAAFGMFMLYRATGARMSVGKPTRAALCIVMAAVAARIAVSQPFHAAALAVIAYVSLLFITRTLTIREVRSLLERKPSTGGSPAAVSDAPVTG